MGVSSGLNVSQDWALAKVACWTTLDVVIVGVGRKVNVRVKVREETRERRGNARTAQVKQGESPKIEIGER